MKPIPGSQTILGREKRNRKRLEKIEIEEKERIEREIYGFNRKELERIDDRVNQLLAVRSMCYDQLWDAEGPVSLKPAI